MWRFHRYYIKELLLNLSLTFVMLFGVALLALVARGIYRSQGIDVLLALWITLLWTVDIVPHLLSISLLVATVFTFGRASADNEILALRMTGLSPLRLMGAVLLVGALTAGVNTWLLHDLIPWVHYKKYRPVGDLVKQFYMQQRPTNNRIEFGPLSMCWERKEGRHYYDVYFKVSRTGRVGNSNGEADEVRRDGFAKELVFDQDSTGRILILRSKDVEAFIFKKEGDKGFHYDSKLELGLDIEVDLQEILERQKRYENFKDLSSSQIMAEIERGGSPRPGQGSWLVFLRSCQGLAGLLFALVGFPIGVLCRRAGRMAAFALSFVPLGFYYTLSYLAPWLARETGGKWPALIPDAVLLLLGYILLRSAFRR